jgi:prepilin-type N-terminal cleavage/methylation domain-containing protein
MESNKGFTLIELLVVISIMGVISSVIFVSFSGSRDKARLAKAQQFDAQISHALSAYAIGIWRFEEGSGTTLYDMSGFENDGTFIGNPSPVFPGGVYSNTTSLEFDGIDDYVSIPDDNSLDITDAITITAWIYDPPLEPNDQLSVINNQSPPPENLIQSHIQNLKIQKLQDRVYIESLYSKS